MPLPIFHLPLIEMYVCAEEGCGALFPIRLRFQPATRTQECPACSGTAILPLSFAFGIPKPWKWQKGTAA
jgi:hypothetical protein